MSDVVVSSLVKEVSFRTGAIVVETLLPPRFFWLNRFILPVYVLLCAILGKVLGRGIAVGSFSNASLPTLILSGWLLQNRCLAVLNHNHTTKSRVVMVLIWLLCKSGARVLAFDLPVESEAALCRRPWFLKGVRSIPHPVPAGKVRTSGSSGGELRIGVAGRIRKEKSLVDSIDLIGGVKASLCAMGYSVTPVLAAPCAAWSEFRDLLSDWDFADTSSYDQYLAALGSLDIVVLLYSREAYEWRPSGVASEAIAAGAFVVARDTPVIRRQLSDPSPVGYCIEEGVGFQTVVSNLIGRFMDFRACPKNNYMNYRDLKAVAELVARDGCKG